MPPKAENKEPVKLVLGRPGNGVKMGIVGMPNVGKSSLFNLLSGLQVPAENYPFCTIDPSTATVPVPDARYDFLKETWKPKSRVSAVLTITDIAGLVKGASEGKGLGNAFLSHIAAVDGIFHVTRAFEAKDIEHVEGDVDPVRDFDIIKTELVKKDIEKMIAQVALLEKKLITKAPGVKDDLESAKKALAMLEEGKEIRHGQWNNKDVTYLNTQLLLTAKPVVFLVNISEKNFVEQKSKFLKGIKEWVTKNSPESPIIPFSVAFEQKLKGIEAKSGDEAKKFLEESKVPCMLSKIISKGYESLNLIHFFTTGADEVRCWTIQNGCKAPEAAGTIHTDFEKGFICADIYNFEDFKVCGSESAVKAAGKSRSQGKEYIMKDGDICFFKHNAKSSTTKKKAGAKE
jgi:obg-like ATPase 1